MKKIIFLNSMILLMLLVACTKESITPAQVEYGKTWWSDLWNGAKKVALTLGADAAGAYSGAKVGAWVGSVGEPHGATLGGVVGATAGGAYASYKTGAHLAKHGLVVSTNNFDDDLSNVDFSDVQSKDFGIIHNHLLRYFFQNDSLISNASNEALEVYRLSMQFFEDSLGISNPTYYMDFNRFSSITNNQTFDSFETIKSFISSTENDENVANFLNSSVTCFENSTSLAMLNSKVDSLENVAANNTNFTSTQLFNIYAFLGTAKYSAHFWNANIECE